MTKKIDFFKTQQRATRSTEAAFGVPKITVVHVHAKNSKNTSSFTDPITYNFQLISVLNCIFSSERSGHLFQK